MFCKRLSPFDGGSFLLPGLKQTSLSYVIHPSLAEKARTINHLLDRVFMQEKSGGPMSPKSSHAYKNLCTEYYEIDKPTPPEDALDCYSTYAAEANGHLLEPMCGSGRFLVPLLKKGYSITGFDTSSQMLNACWHKCQKENLNCTLLEASFSNFVPCLTYQLVFIPSGSFCLLTKKEEISQALQVIHKCLEKNGKFVFEIDTPASLEKNDGSWKGSWIERPDGAKVVSSSLSRYDRISKIQSSLFRYELWENNLISKTEVEEFHLRLFSIEEMEKLLNDHHFKVLNKRVPYTKQEPDEKSEYVLFECARV